MLTYKFFDKRRILRLTVYILTLIVVYADDMDIGIYVQYRSIRDVELNSFNGIDIYYRKVYTFMFNDFLFDTRRDETIIPCDANVK